ncbi:MAG TPA: hypothetical protein VN033_00765 [Vulgatibacter sp.]|nr:hypothetical protein [Vulgatibacter sp.]
MRTCAAIAASALVHGLLLLALRLAPPPQAEAPPDQRPIEIVILDAPRAVGAPATPSASAGQDEPTAAAKVPGARVAAPPAAASAPAEGIAPVPGGPAASEGSLTLVPEERLIERRLDEMFAEDRAEKTAWHRADSYWFELRRRLERDFAPPRES